MDKRVKWLVILLVVILMDCAGKGFLPPTIVPEAAGSQRAFLPIVTEPGPVLYVGDSLTSATPGYVELVGEGERAITYHLGDSILYLQEAGYHRRIVLELGFHAVHGSDRLYYNNPDLFRYRYHQLIREARDHAGEVVIINIPWAIRWKEKEAKATEFNAIIADLADQMDICVADAWTVMQQCGLKCMDEDGYHPNERGYGLIAQEVSKCDGLVPAGSGRASSE